MAIATTSKFESTFSIDEVIEESYERLGLQVNSGYDLKTARRSLNIMFQEWANRGVHLWKVKLAKVPLVVGVQELSGANVVVSPSSFTYKDWPVAEVAVALAMFTNEGVDPV